MRAALRDVRAPAAHPRPAALRGAGPRSGALRGARPRSATLRGARPRLAAVLLGLLALAGAVAVLRGGSTPALAEPNVVPLRVYSGHGIATGFAIGDGRVVTVAHVLDGPVTVRGRRVRVLRVDRRSDLALLSVPGLGGTVPELSSAANGEHLRVVRVRAGRPLSLSVHVRRAIVAHVRAPGAARPVRRPALELSASGHRGRVAPGDSGAAVVRDSGEVAGIVFAASRNRAGTAYAVDASQVRRLLRRSSVE
jgi:S1-C subfamily serine protease